MQKKFTIVITREKDGLYIGNVPELPGCHTQAKTLDQLVERVKEAIELYLEVKKIKKSDYKSFIGIQTVSLA
jgi:predicted RNase H-like HicB family nuclease